jgi:hypothetical protein
MCKISPVFVTAKNKINLHISVRMQQKLQALWDSFHPFFRLPSEKELPYGDMRRENR